MERNVAWAAPELFSTGVVCADSYQKGDRTLYPPTDNLYKFIAISGLVCYLFFFFDISKKIDLLEEYVSEREVQSAELNAETNNLGGATNRMTSLLKQYEKVKPNRAAKAEIKEQQRQLLERFERLAVVRAKHDAQLSVARGKLESIRDYIKHVELYSYGAIFLFVFGLCLWYERTQKYADIKDARV